MRIWLYQCDSTACIQLADYRPAPLSRAIDVMQSNRHHTHNTFVLQSIQLTCLSCYIHIHRRSILIHAVSSKVTLWLQSFFSYPSLGIELIFYKTSPGIDFLFQCLLFDTDYFDTHVSRVENWSSAPIHSTELVYIHFLKWITSLFNFRSYVLNIVKININCCLSKFDSPWADLSATRT